MTAEDAQFGELIERAHALGLRDPGDARWLSFLPGANTCEAFVRWASHHEDILEGASLLSATEAVGGELAWDRVRARELGVVPRGIGFKGLGEMLSKSGGLTVRRASIDLSGLYH
jgi:hypothetical protein